MSKLHKKKIWGTSLIVLAVIQIVHFARFRPRYFPRLNLDFNRYGFFRLIFNIISWPFQFLNHSSYYLFGWAGLFIPLFLIALGFTFFYERDTKKVKRKRIIILWGVLELVFFIYFINSLSAIIIPRSVSVGILSKLFGTYLMKIGGFSFITLFFLWSFISYILYIRKKTWQDFFKALKQFFRLLLHNLARAFAEIFKTHKKVKRIEKIKNVKVLEDKGQKDKEKIESEEEMEEELVEDLKETQIKDKKKRVIDVEYEVVAIREFDSRDLDFQFNYESLCKSKENEVDQTEIEGDAQKIKEIFRSFDISLKQAGITIGPRLIRLEFDFPKNTQLKDLEKHKEELSYRMGGIPIEMEIPIPNTDRFGIYIGRKDPDILGLNTYLSQINKRDENIPVFLGVKPDGSGLWSDATAFPHLLIGGTTGSGKSVFLNTIIINLLAASISRPVNLILIDPKRVEFSPYQELKQLSFPIVTDLEVAREILSVAEEVMEKRYKKVTACGVRNIYEYNELQDSEMPFLFIIIDEFADLVMQDKSGTIKNSIIRLAQKSRAVGIHVIIATQRPSANVIDGLIKANFPARVAFKTSSKVDSRIILDENGAENLLGKGDMIVKITADDKNRLQGILINIEEIKNIVSSNSSGGRKEQVAK